MHIFFSGIGGTGIGPLAMIAKQAGYEVSGSDKQDSQYIQYLKNHDIPDIEIGQTLEQIQQAHEKKPIDWYVFSSAVQKENPNHPELQFVSENNIRSSKRDELLNQIISEKNLKLLAIAGTHGKTTTTAMLIYLLKALEIPLSYSVGAKISFGDMGHYEPGSEYFALEADEFDRNFLSFSPYSAIISGIGYDHHEIYPTKESYKQAFTEFLGKSQNKILWQSDFDRLNIPADDSYKVLSETATELNDIQLIGDVNRRDALLVIETASQITQKPVAELIEIMNGFPGLSRRMEQIIPNLYSDYAHTTEKIIGAIDLGMEITHKQNSKLVVVYEPLTNRRMHHTASLHKDIFDQAEKLYWVPSYLAREDPNQSVLTPDELIKNLNQEMQTRSEPAELTLDFKNKIDFHINNGDVVLALSGGGGGSLDEWLRENFIV